MTKELTFIGHNFTENHEWNNKVLARIQTLWVISLPIYYWTNSPGYRKPSAVLLQPMLM